MGVVVRRYIDFLIILLIPTPLVLPLFAATSCSFFKCCLILVYVIFVRYSKRCSKNIRDCLRIEITLTWQYNYINKNVHVHRLRVPRLPSAKY